MKIHEFTLILGQDPNDDEADRLYGEVRDATLATSGGIAELAFHRKADTLENALRTAIEQVRKAGFPIDRVEMPVEPLLETA